MYFVDLEKPKKPGKLSADLLNKFVSDPALTQPQPLQVNRLSALSFSSSSGEITTSQENVKSKKAEHVRIKEPGENDEQLCPSSADEDMLSDDEAGKETKTKKRALKWKWSPFKKMRRLFRRKKSPRRVKSCEELPIEQYKPTYVQTSAEDDDTLRNRTKSEPSLTEAKKKTPLAEVYETGPTADNLVYRTQSDPSSKVCNTSHIQERRWIAIKLYSGRRFFSFIVLKVHLTPNSFFFFPPHFHRKCIENSVENIHADIRV